MSIYEIFFAGDRQNDVRDTLMAILELIHEDLNRVIEVTTMSWLFMLAILSMNLSRNLRLVLLTVSLLQQRKLSVLK